MNEPKKRTFEVALTDKEAKAFFEKCFQDGTTPEEVLEGFICDLTGADRRRGSDESDLAGRYYDRCGYGYFLSTSRTFAQWLVYDGTIETVEETLRDISDLEKEIAYLKERPEEAEEGELEDLEAELKEGEAEIEDYYQEYKKHAETPESLECGIKGVREYMAKKEY